MADDGYGVSYMVPDDNYFFFHISSKRSSSKTDSERLMDHVVKSLHDMKAMFLEVEGKGKEAKKKDQ